MSSNPIPRPPEGETGAYDLLRSPASPETPAAYQRSVQLEMSSIVVQQGHMQRPAWPESVELADGPVTPGKPESPGDVAVALRCASCGPPSMGDAHSRIGSTVQLMDPPSVSSPLEGEFVPTPDTHSPKHHKQKQSSCSVHIHKFLDLFVVEPRAANKIGSGCTILVVAASFVYGIILLLQALNKPLLMQNHVFWSAGKSFPCKFQCRAPSGCLVSNTLKPSEPQPCQTVNYLDFLDLQMGRSEDPAMGISVAALRSGAEPLATINSDMYMEPDPSLAVDNPMNTGIVDFVVDMPSQLSQGTHLAWYVETHNNTRTGKGKLRREFFVQQVNSDGAVLASSTSCAVPEGWVQARIRLMPQWNQITVDYEISLMDWFGTSAGMYAAFVSWGAVIVGTYEFWHGMLT